MITNGVQVCKTKETVFETVSVVRQIRVTVSLDQLMREAFTDEILIAAAFGSTALSEGSHFVLPLLVGAAARSIGLHGPAPRAKL